MTGVSARAKRINASIRLSSYLLLVATLTLCPLTANAKFYYQNFNDRSHLNLAGEAARQGECVGLTSSPQKTSQIGAFWYDRPVDVSKGFSTSFSYWHPPELADGSSTPVSSDPATRLHGLAFVVQRTSSDALGRGDDGLGYDGLFHGLAVEFDLQRSTEDGDPSYEHISVHSAMHAPLSSIEPDGSHALNSSAFAPHNSTVRVQITYNNGRIKVFLGKNRVTPVVNVKIGIIDGKVWVGFTGSSTKSRKTPFASMRVCDWYFELKQEEGDKCDDGFVGSACEVDNSALLHECISKMSCNQCVSSTRDCRWCPSKKRCVAGILFDAKMPESCPRLEQVSDVAECLHVPASLVWIWTIFVILLLLVVAVGFFIKIMTRPPNYYYDENHRRSTSCLHEFADISVAIGVGALFALCVSIAVNFILVEISLNPVFAVIFGLLFIFIGGLLFWQTITYHFSGPVGEFVGSIAHCIMLLAFAILILSSGVVVFLLERDWSHTLSYKAKIPLYGVLGISLCFSLVFTIQDLLIRVPLCLKSAHVIADNASPLLVGSVLRTRLLACTSILSGLYFGWVFGMLDVEDVSRSHLELALQEANMYCYPLGCLLGGISAFISYIYSSNGRRGFLSETGSPTEMRLVDEEDGL